MSRPLPSPQREAKTAAKVEELMPPLTTARPTDKLLKLRDEMRVFWSKQRASGRKFTAYYCNFCRRMQPTDCPNPQDTGSKGYWDSLTTCTGCGGLNMVLVWPMGRTESIKFGLKRGLQKESAMRRVLPRDWAGIIKYITTSTV